ncbi:MAG: carboxypeptidase-like regulatory domain-containing protein [Candidatus Aminicenantes bacterium]|nr:carboxypeptidase-like regulatory domain-containing protein [Candidatus Aminicenantes bacterium]
MRNRNRFLVGLVLLASLTAYLAGQSATGQIFGNVKNTDDDYLPGITVMVTNIATTASVTVVTAKKGRFRFLALDPGLYQISIEQEGYVPRVISGVRLLGGQALNIPVKLKKKS